MSGSAPAVTQQPFPPSAVSLHPPQLAALPAAASTPHLSESLDNKQEHSIPARDSAEYRGQLSSALAVSAVPAASQVHSAKRVGALQPVCEEPQSPLAGFPAEGCMTLDAGSTPRPMLKPISVSPSDEQRACIASRSAVTPVSPVMVNSAPLTCNKSASHTCDAAGVASPCPGPCPGASGNSGGTFGLTRETLRMWSMHDAGSGDADMHNATSGVTGCVTKRSSSMSPIPSRGRMSPHCDPISSPSQWDEEDPLSIYKPQNLAFMPLGRGQALRGVLAGVSDMERRSSAVEGTAVPPEASDTQWHPWNLFQQRQVRQYAQSRFNVCAVFFSATWRCGVPTVGLFEVVPFLAAGSWIWTRC